MVLPASSPAVSSPLQIDLSRDLQLTLTGLYVSVAAELSDPAFDRPWEAPSPRGVNALDRTVIGNRSGTASALSDSMLATNLTLPFVASLVDNLFLQGGGSWDGLGSDSLVLLETIAVGSIVCNVVKYGVRRPRPYVYDPSTDPEKRRSNTATLSFFSGHTSLAFSMATAYSYLFTLRHPESPMVLPVWLFSHSVAATTAVMRVEGGKHFWTDVVTGALVGSAVGLFVPALHRGAGWNGVFGEDGLLADLRATPAFYGEGGWGVNIMLLW